MCHHIKQTFKTAKEELISLASFSECSRKGPWKEAFLGTFSQWWNWRQSCKPVPASWGKPSGHSNWTVWVGVDFLCWKGNSASVVGIFFLIPILSLIMCLKVSLLVSYTANVSNSSLKHLSLCSGYYLTSALYSTAAAIQPLLYTCCFQRLYVYWIFLIQSKGHLVPIQPPPTVLVLVPPSRSRLLQLSNLVFMWDS